MALGRKREARTALFITAKEVGRPHPNPPPEGERVCHTPSKKSLMMR